MAGPDRRGALKTAGPGVAALNISLEMTPRALSLLESLIRTIERLGHSVFMRSDPAELNIDDTAVQFLISEKFLRSNVEPDDAELARRAEMTRRHPKYVAYLGVTNPWIFRPSCSLTITLSCRYVHRERAIWHDTASKAIESQINEIVAGAVVHAAAQKAQEREAERRRQMAEEAERRREEARAAKAKEERRIEFLTERADLFDQADALSRFVRHLQHTAPDPRPEKLVRFLEWANEHVSDLREACSAATIGEDLDDDLW